MSVDCSLAARGGRGLVQRKRSITVTIPEGIDSRRVLRLAGQGEPGDHGDPPSDLQIEIEVRPHPTLERDG